MSEKTVAGPTQILEAHNRVKLAQEADHAALRVRLAAFKAAKLTRADLTEAQAELARLIAEVAETASI